MFAGNSDRYTVQIIHLEPTIEAQYIKIVPDEWRNQISLRLELYGCSQGEKSRIEIVLHICIICHAGVYSVKADRSYKQKAQQLLIESARLLFTLQCRWAMAVHRCPGRVGFPWASRAVGFLIRRSRRRRSLAIVARLFLVDSTTSGREQTGWRGLREGAISISGGRWISARRRTLRWLQLKGGGTTQTG